MHLKLNDRQSPERAITADEAEVLVSRFLFMLTEKQKEKIKGLKVIRIDISEAELTLAEGCLESQENRAVRECKS